MEYGIPRLHSPGSFWRCSDIPVRAKQVLLWVFVENHSLPFEGRGRGEEGARPLRGRGAAEAGGRPRPLM